MSKRECVDYNGKVLDDTDDSWIKEMVDDIDAMFKKYPDAKIYKVAEI